MLTKICQFQVALEICFVNFNTMGRIGTGTQSTHVSEGILGLSNY